MKHLPGNPYDPREAQRLSGCALPLDEITSDAISEIGLTDATMIGLHLDRLTHATMALAYEQRTANLIAIAEHDETLPYRHGEALHNLWLKIFTRTGTRKDPDQ